ncbi:tripartite tricarboxylate transporter TctB family protein [Salipiger thiooxidans]|uniref:tripartite tricarboxylate transporter TctB family protein n=1 Tax=Salipiger thiooxidans TaxID=282683 RepID=UPI001CD6E240|nr:tripartite tricarboxylate transporter TctB family protein [Salipiger thiooxidans]MCA0851396.1 tripartite tricarboxylate transporter TctB family protein [Salipiger thiooxidans]
MKLFSGRIAFDTLMLAASAYGLWLSTKLPSGGGISGIGPSDFPMAICALATLSMLVILGQDLRHEMVAGDVTERMTVRQILGVCGVAALLALYLFCLEPLGFIAATMGFLFFCAMSTGWLLTPSDESFALTRTAVISALVAVVATLATFFSFSYGFGLIFP